MALELTAHLGDDEGKARHCELPVTTITSSGEAGVTVERSEAQDSL